MVKDNILYFLLGHCYLLYKAIKITKLEVLRARIGANVWRYVQVAAESRWRVFLHSWCDAGLSGYYFILALAKTVTPEGSPAGAGASRTADYLAVLFSQKVLAVRKANDIYRPVSSSAHSLFVNS